MNTDQQILSDLAQRLEANGMVVLPIKDHLEIRLPLFASVKVRIVDGRLSCEPRFGFLPRDRATWATLIGLAAVTALSFADLGVTSVSMLLGFLSLSSSASTAIRYQLTEASVAQVRTAFMSLTPMPARATAAPESHRAISQPEPDAMSNRADAVAVQRVEK